MITRKLYILSVWMILWSIPAWVAAVELDANGDGKIDDGYIPSTITRDSELTSGLAGKQDALGYTPENSANKGVANGYAGLGADGKVPAAQLPESTGTDDQVATEVPVTPWGTYAETNVQTLMLEIDTALRELIPTVPTTLAELTDDATHRLVTDTEKSAWDAKQNALVADTDYLTPGAAAAAYQPIMGVDDNYVTDAEKVVIGNTSGTNTGDQDLSGYVLSSTLGTAAQLDPGTDPGDLVQLGGACTVGDGSYTDEATCTANSGQWVGVLAVICDPDTEACNTKLDLISAYEIDQRVAIKQDAMGADDNYVTDAEKVVIGNTSGTNTGDQDLSGYQLALTVPDQAEAEAGTATTVRGWTAQRIAQAIAALAPGGADEIVYLSDCSTITNGFCIDTDDGAPYYWNGAAVTAISGGTVDLTAPGPIGSVTPNTGTFTTLTAASFDTSAPESGETGEIGFQEDPANGTNVVTLKAAADMATDLIFTLPNAYAGADNYALVGNGSGMLTFVQVLLPTNIGTTVQAYDGDLADLADGSLTGTKVDLSANTGTIYTSGSLYGRSPIIAKTANATLTAQECSGGIITNTGATGPIVLTLPAMSAGMRCTILLTAAYDVDVNPNNANQILLKADAVGDAVSSDATIGSYLSLTAVSTGWMPLGGERGTWTDVN